MERDWPETFAERMRWVRLEVAKLDKPTDAARLLDIRPGTYRTYEAEKADGGREPPLLEVQRIARRFGVSWVWLLTGEGRWNQGVFVDPRVNTLNDKVARLNPADRETALQAALNVIDAFSHKKSA